MKGLNTAMPGMDRDYMAESDLRTLMEAEAIEKNPKRLKAARALAKQKLADLSTVIGEKE